MGPSPFKYKKWKKIILYLYQLTKKHRIFSFYMAIQTTPKKKTALSQVQGYQTQQKTQMSNV